MATRGVDEANTHDDASAALETGVRDQVLNISGWFASHADAGTPGPHVALQVGGSSTMRPAVLRTSQVPDLIKCLRLVADRIDRQWAEEGDDFLRTFDGPDANAPEVIRQGRLRDLELTQRIAEAFPAIVEIFIGADDIHDATTATATLLGVEDDVALEGRLIQFSLWGLTRGSREARVQAVKDLRT